MKYSDHVVGNFSQTRNEDRTNEVIKEIRVRKEESIEAIGGNDKEEDRGVFGNTDKVMNACVESIVSNIVANSCTIVDSIPVDNNECVDNSIYVNKSISVEKKG